MRVGVRVRARVEVEGEGEGEGEGTAEGGREGGGREGGREGGGSRSVRNVPEAPVPPAAVVSLETARYEWRHGSNVGR